MQRRTLCLAPLSLLAACATPPAAAPSDLWFILLEAGRPTPPDKAAVAAMQTGHIDNFKRLFAQGRLLAAGPLSDPGGPRRGIVVVRADSLAMLTGYFEPDTYVREGHMTLNARRAVAHRPLHTEGIDASRIEEVRIVLIGRPAGPDPSADRRSALLRGLVDAGRLGAWYTLADGPVAEVLLARGTDSAALQSALAPYADAGPAVRVEVLRQWIAPGVVGPR
ncbi:YciI family protein [Pseudaquabacterium pictum]|nr:YciI family protein [Rubrivivax pictus]